MKLHIPYGHYALAEEWQIPVEELSTWAVKEIVARGGHMLSKQKHDDTVVIPKGHIASITQVKVNPHNGHVKVRFYKTHDHIMGGIEFTLSIDAANNLDIEEYNP